MSELRALYIDEFVSYFKELVKILENEGLLKAGTSEKVDHSDKDDVQVLKSEMKNLFAQKKRK